MKKVLAFLLACSVFCSISVPAFARSGHMNTVEEYAYMDLESAPKSLQQQILAARNDIIFNTSWIADDLDAYVTDAKGNIIEEVPHFSEVFPSDWEVPVLPVTHQNNTSTAPLADDEIDQTTHMVTLTYPSEDYVTPPFTSVATLGFPGTSAEYHIRWITTTGVYTVMGHDATYNLAYTDADTGKVLGSELRLDSTGLTVSFPYDTSHERVNIHASTFDAPGEWTMFVGRGLERP